MAAKRCNFCTHCIISKSCPHDVIGKMLTIRQQTPNALCVSQSSCIKQNTYNLKKRKQKQFGPAYIFYVCVLFTNCFPNDSQLIVFSFSLLFLSFPLSVFSLFLSPISFHPSLSLSLPLPLSPFALSFPVSHHHIFSPSLFGPISLSHSSLPHSFFPLLPKGKNGHMEETVTSKYAYSTIATSPSKSTNISASIQCV